MSRFRLLAVLVISLTMVGCAPQPSPAPTAPQEPASTPTPVAEVVVSSILIGPTELSLLDGEGQVVEAFNYLEPPEAAVAALTDVFGSAPVVTRYESQGDLTASDDYTWGGLLLADTDPLPTNEGGAEFFIRTDAASVGEITITTVDGITVGTTAAAVLATNPNAAHPAQGLLLVEPVELAIGAHSVGLILTGESIEVDPESTVKSVLAPWKG